MLSRVADSIFWMCRYIERAENISRFIDVNWNMMLDAAKTPEEVQWRPLVAVTADEAEFEKRYDAATAENVIRFLAFDPDYANSIISCLSMARENARSIREIIPGVMWEQINTFYHTVRQVADDDRIVVAPHEFLSSVVAESNRFVGLTMTTMTHDDGWHFCRMGRLLERADKTSRILDVKYFYLLPGMSDVGAPMDHIQWAALLRSTSALQAYRRLYGPIEPQHVVEMLLLHRDFPRSVRYCVERCQDSLHSVSGSAPGAYVNEAERRCGKLAADLVYADVGSVIMRGLHEFIDDLQGQFNGVGEAIHNAFFAAEPLDNGETHYPTDSQTQTQTQTQTQSVRT